MSGSLRADKTESPDQASSSTSTCSCNPIPQDILQEILSRIPLIDLVSSYNVSPTWRLTISSSLPIFNKRKPWLLIHSQNTRSPSSLTTLSYDPVSHLWFQIQHPSLHYFSPLRSSHSSLLYMFSSSKFVFSTDPLHLHWTQSSAPIGWRPDPIVASVGNFIIVAGSSCGIQHDLPTMEIYDTTNFTTESCVSIPDGIMDSGVASTWLSVAVDEEKMYVSVKNSGLTYSFDPKNKNWCGPYDVGGDGDGDVFFSVIEFAVERLILVGLSGEVENVRSVIMWELDNEYRKWKEISKMPRELVEVLKGENWYLPSISMVAMGDFVFIHNVLEGEEVIVCEVVDGICRWGSVRIPGFDDGCRLRRTVLSCSNVSLTDLDEALKLGDEHFSLTRS